MSDGERAEQGERRQASFHLSEKHRRESYDIEDERWAAGKQLRDWIMVAFLILLTLGFSLMVAFLEPGMGSLGN